MATNSKNLLGQWRQPQQTKSGASRGGSLSGLADSLETLSNVLSGGAGAEPVEALAETQEIVGVLKGLGGQASVAQVATHFSAWSPDELAGKLLLAGKAGKIAFEKGAPEGIMVTLKQ